MPISVATQSSQPWVRKRDHDEQAAADQSEGTDMATAADVGEATTDEDPDARRACS